MSSGIPLLSVVTSLRAADLPAGVYGLTRETRADWQAKLVSRANSELRYRARKSIPIYFCIVLL